MTATELTKRLLTYRLSLLHLKEIGLDQVYSHIISAETGYSSAIIRKDFSKLKIQGKKRGGYSIDNILDSISLYFGESKLNEVILVGTGNIGQAIIHYKDFKKYNIKIAAAFDVDPARQRKKLDVPVYPPDHCFDFVRKHKIISAIIAVPSFSAQNVCDQLIYCGIKGILNFAPVNLKTPDDVYVSNISLTGELQQVIYHASQLKTTKRK
ncbi:MAG: redox-sensing transcriptional repressor Rex [Bacteroidales bacterium]|nr:redox-sensing transcriptional repressor Rex [Bacteroidales bacterium]